jgi:hypothetical protein
MLRRSIPGVVLALLVSVIAVDATVSDSAQTKGRYKKDGANCVWDANDTGPNQCRPLVAGRFKRSGETCVWVSRDRGADQCTPATGRFKKQGTGCVWDSKDSGPNQCNPRQPR